LHPVVAPYKRSKKRVKMPPKLLFWARKNEFFSGEGAHPSPQTPPRTHHLGVSPPPPSEILNTLLSITTTAAGLEKT